MKPSSDRTSTEHSEPGGPHIEPPVIDDQPEGWINFRAEPGPQDEKYLPSPEEIRRACLEIQAGWSKTEERLRRTGRVPPQRLTLDRPAKYHG